MGEIAQYIKENDLVNEVKIEFNYKTSKKSSEIYGNEKNVTVSFYILVYLKPIIVEEEVPLKKNYQISRRLRNSEDEWVGMGQFGCLDIFTETVENELDRYPKYEYLVKVIYETEEEYI